MNSKNNESEVLNTNEIISDYQFSLQLINENRIMDIDLAVA